MKIMKQKCLFKQRSKIANLIKGSTNKNSFSSLQSSFSNKQFSELLKVYLTLPDSKKRVIEVPKSSTLKEFEQEIKKVKNFENIEIRSWDNSIVSKSNTIEQALLENAEPIFMKIDKMEWQELSLKSGDNTSPNQEVNHHNHLQDRERIITVLKEVNKNIKLLDNEIEALEVKISQIKHYYNNSLENKIIDSAKYPNLSVLFEDLYSSKAEFRKLNFQYNQLNRNAEKKAFFVILLGGLLFVIELILLYYGTFVELSWDITEPITYLVTCLNLVLVLGMKKKFRGLSAHEYFTKRFLDKKLKSFNTSKFNSLKSNISEIEHKLN